MMLQARRLLLNLMLILLGTLCGILISEGIVRTLKPGLGDIVDSGFQEHSYRIHANPRNASYTRVHPATRERHVVIHNSFGFRQHREFDTPGEPEKVRIGFFGDSYTENLRMEAPYSFTEPLDYLLNEAGLASDVLNFGTDGYGTDQVYLQYMDEGADLGLSIVFYVFCHNDLRDILADRLFELSPSGDMRYVPRQVEQPLWKTVVKKFYLTYLIMEGTSHLQTILSRPSYDPDTIVTKMPGEA